MSNNSIRISYSQNPDLKDFFGRQNSGDDIELGIIFKITSITADEVTGSLTDVELPDEETDEGPVETNALEPAAILIRSSKAKPE